MKPIDSFIFLCLDQLRKVIDDFGEGRFSFYSGESDKRIVLGDLEICNDTELVRFTRNNQQVSKYLLLRHEFSLELT